MTQTQSVIIALFLSLNQSCGKPSNQCMLNLRTYIIIHNSCEAGILKMRHMGRNNDSCKKKVKAMHVPDAC